MFFRRYYLEIFWIIAILVLILCFGIVFLAVPKEDFWFVLSTVLFGYLEVFLILGIILFSNGWRNRYVTCKHECRNCYHRKYYPHSDMQEYSEIQFKKFLGY